MTITKTLRLLGVLALSALAACTSPAERPTLIDVSHQEALEMEPAALDAAIKKGVAKASTLTTLDEGKFAVGDPIDFQVGDHLEVYAVYVPLLQMAHVKFVHDPDGVEGAVTSTTFVMKATERGISVSVEGGSPIMLAADFDKSPDVWRLIISKIGDIAAAAVNGSVSAGIASLCGDCGGGGSVAISSAGAAADQLTQIGLETLTGRQSDGCTAC